MESIFAELWTPEMQSVFNILVLFVAALYILSIAWVVKDSYMRGRYWFVWGIVSLIPFLGVIAYILLRPSMYSLDKNEQELEIAFKTRELQKYGNCGKCGAPVQSDFVLCPNCHQKLKNLCPGCNRALELNWSICPYCATSAGNAMQSNVASGVRRGTSRNNLQHPHSNISAPNQNASNNASGGRIARKPSSAGNASQASVARNQASSRNQARPGGQGSANNQNRPSTTHTN